MIELPKGTQILEISPSGASYWARTAKIETVNAQGEAFDYFVKVSERHPAVELSQVINFLMAIAGSPRRDWEKCAFG